MATIRPPTRTPGSLKIIYKHVQVPHRCSVNLLASVDIYDFGQRRIDAISLAGKIQGVMPGSVEIASWALYTRPGTGVPAQLIYSEAFTGPYIGVAPGLAGDVDYLSKTTTVTGTGTPGQQGYAVGACRLVLFNGNAIHFTQGEKTCPANNLTPNAGWGILLTELTTSPHIWADFYGQKATYHSLMPIQFNAHVQRVHGS